MLQTRCNITVKVMIMWVEAGGGAGETEVINLLEPEFYI